MIHNVYFYNLCMINSGFERKTGIKRTERKTEKNKSLEVMSFYFEWFNIMKKAKVNSHI